MRHDEKRLSFSIDARDGAARAGVIQTSHGPIETPAFIPLATKGSVRGLDTDEVAGLGYQLILGNTYHLFDSPGPERIAAAGDLHGFMNWDRALITDSGGFQVFSLAHGGVANEVKGSGRKGDHGSEVEITEEGARFRSPRDGRDLFLSPEVSMKIQAELGADIALAFDECTPFHADRDYTARSTERTHRWLDRCVAWHEAEGPERQALFGIIQGGTHPDLRRAHADELGAMPFDGLALGGFSVGEPIERMHDVVGEVASYVDPARPRYLMGVGTPRDLILAIGAGVDMFDCVLPTRNARNGQALLQHGRVVIKQARYKDDLAPLDPTCGCPTCTGGYSRAYLRHLYIAKEILVLRLFTAHNLHLYGRLVREAREAIARGGYAAFAREWAEAGIGSA